MTRNGIYVTGQNDVLDLVCRRRYGGERGALELVLAANPGLAARGEILPAGIEIRLPELPARRPSAAPARVRLWD
jgi:phage tail protein X